MTTPSAGHAIEDFARRLAGHLGVRDFVYQPVQVPRGKGSTREVSDGLLIVGDNGLILQVKSRDPDAAGTDSADKARSWCLKNATAAVRQADGTRRTIAMSPVTVQSLRGFQRTLPTTAATWPTVAIIDHAADPVLPVPSTPNTLYISLNDWLQLHRLIRSTWGVIDYVHRVLKHGLSTDLGNEQRRYTALAAADLDGCNTATAVPTLPLGIVTGQAASHTTAFDDLIDKVADPVGATGWDPVQYLHVVEALDRVPALLRPRIGERLQQTLLRTYQSRTQQGFLTRQLGVDGPNLCFLTDAAENVEASRHWHQVTAYGALRRAQSIAAGIADPMAGLLTVGIHHHLQLGHRYTFYYEVGDVAPLDESTRARLEKSFGIFDGRSTREAPR